MGSRSSRRRGRTRSGRLATLDDYLVRHQAPLLLRGDGTVLFDVGVGAEPWTTLELSRTVREISPSLVTFGFESDAQRLSTARALAAGNTVQFFPGDFETPLPAHPPARLVRAMNVVRGWPAHEVPRLWRHLLAPLAPEGLLLEGSSDPHGHMLSAFLLRKRECDPFVEGLLLLTDFERGFSPWMFRDVLPRALRRAVFPGTPIHGLLGDWERCWNLARQDEKRPELLFRLSAHLLAEHRSDVQPLDARGGAVLWKQPKF